MCSSDLPAAVQQKKAVPERPVEPKEQPASAAIDASGPIEQSEAAKAVATGPPPAKPAVETSKNEPVDVRERGAAAEQLPTAAPAKPQDEGAPPAASNPADPEGRVASFPVAFHVLGDYDSRLVLFVMVL